MSDFENDDNEEIEFVALDKLQISHEKFEQCLEYTFGKNDFVEDTEKQHFLLKFEIAQSILAEIETHFGSKIPLDLSSKAPIDLIVFLNTFIGDDLSNTEPDVAINIFVVEDFDDLDRELGVWKQLDKATMLSENRNEWFDDSDLDAEGYSAFESLASMDETFLHQLSQLMEQDESGKEMLETFMNHLVMDMLETKGELSNEEALEKFLEISKRRNQDDPNGVESDAEKSKVSEIFVDFSQKASTTKGTDDDPESNS